MNDQKTVVDYAYWLKMDLWTIKEAASLLSSVEPNSDASNSTIPLKVGNMIQAGIIAETLVIDRVNPKTNEAMFYPMNIIHWVKFQKGFNLLPAPIDEWYGEEYHYRKTQEVNAELYEPTKNERKTKNDLRNADFQAWIDSEKPELEKMIKDEIHECLMKRDSRHLWASGFKDWWSQQNIYKGVAGRKKMTANPT